MGLALGLVLAVLGVVVSAADRFSSLGRLPGDTHVRKGGWELHFPIVSCLVVSAVVSLVLALFRR